MPPRPPDPGASFADLSKDGDGRTVADRTLQLAVPPGCLLDLGDDGHGAPRVNWKRADPVGPLP